MLLYLLVVRVARFFAPGAFDDLAVHLCIVHGHNGVCRRLLGGESYESVAFVLENADLLDDAERAERLLNHLLTQALAETWCG